MDYELISENVTGLDLIEELNIAKNAILVTSHYESTSIQQRCAQLNVKIISKSYSPFVDIFVTNN